MYSRNGLIKHPTDDIVRMINRLPAEQRDRAMQVSNSIGLGYDMV
jgi:hypothetical protein